MKTKRTAAFMLALITLLLSFAACVSAYGKSDINKYTDKKTASPLALSDTDGAFGITLSPAELLSLLIHGELQKEEAEYLNGYFEYFASYSAPADPSLVALAKDGTQLTVTAQSYTYTAENGTTVSWIPEKAVSGNTEKEFSSLTSLAPYTATLSESDGDTVTVYYSCRIELDEATADRLLNFAYSDAMTAQSIDGAAEYSEALAQWKTYLKALEAYESDLAKYNGYLSALEEYNTQKASYDKYQKELAEYKKKLAVYEKYVADYNAYLAQMSEYERKYLESIESSKKYVEYLNHLNLLRSSLNAMESLFKWPTSGETGTLFKALQNPDLIAMLEKYQSTMAIYNISAKDIAEMRAASNQLNELLNGYAKAREESEAAAFAFYKENYTELSVRFNTLYERMSSAVSGRLFNHICSMIEVEYGDPWMREYKKWRVKNVLAHIYLICLCLDDTQTAEGTWEFFDDSGKPHIYHFSDLLDQNLILPDTNSSNPANLYWQDEPERIPLPSVPKEPKQVEEPLAPAKVEEPIKPTEVKKPTELTKKEEPKAPSANDLSLVRKTAEITELIKSGKLAMRTPSETTRTLHLSYKLKKAIPSDSPKISFYSDNGEYLGSEAVVDGEFNTPDIPATKQDERYDYTLLGWSLLPKELREIPSDITTDISVFALYGRSSRKYSVTFDVNGTITPAEYEYGEMPKIPSDTAKAPSEDTVYTFVGWSPEPTRVMGNAVYSAQYLESERTYKLTWRSEDGDTVRYAHYGETPTAPTVMSVYYSGLIRYELMGWTPSIAPVSCDTLYSAVYKETLLVAPEEGSSAKLDVQTGRYILSSDGSLCDVSKLLKAAAAEGRALNVSLGSRLTADINAEAVKGLSRAGATAMALISDTDGGIGIAFYGEGGTPVSPYSGEIRISLSGYENAKGALTVSGYYRNGTHRTVASSLSGGTVSFIGAANATWRVASTFTLSVSASKGGTVFASSQRYAAGEKPKILAYPDAEYKIASIKLINNDSKEERVYQSLSELVMPEFNASLYVEFIQKTYTVTFIARGEVISSEQYPLGEEPNIPEAPSTYDEDGYRYTFIGWTRPIKTVTGDEEYVATYYSFPIPTDKHGNEIPIEETGRSGSTWATGTALVETVIPICIICAILVFGGIAIGILLRKNLRIRKKRKERIRALESERNEKRDKEKKDD